ncbi:hypothetical protein Tco_0656739 [Tanacetum coccineum]|uniref:Uncharacterized protein n=1 Tax=Tanacetum coccineum TaxID=301880 RepID=A0ABQ4XAB0_9ASTR
MMLESIENGPLVYPTIEEDGKIRDKKYAELTEQEKLQDDCDVQATNIVLQGLPPDVYSLVNHLAVPSFLPGDDLIACLNKAMAFMLTLMASHFPSTNNQLRTSSNPRNQATIQDGKVKQGLLSVIIVRVKGIWQDTALNLRGQGILSRNSKWSSHSDNNPTDAAFQTDDLHAYGISSAKAVLMANLSSYDLDVISEPSGNASRPWRLVDAPINPVLSFLQSLDVDYEPLD